MWAATLANKQELGFQATRLLEDSIFAASIARLEETYIAKWRGSKDTQEREDLHKLVNLIDQFKEDMRSVILTGDIEAKAQEKPNDD